MERPPGVCVDYLCDYPAALTVLAEAFRRESPDYFREWSASDVIDRLLTPSLQRDALPLTLVAVEGDTVVGTIALRHDSITTHRHLGPWLAALHVLQPFRGRGIGTLLIRHAEREAARLGYTTLYAGSGRAASLFTRLGWQAIERVAYCGSPLLILRRAVAVSPR